MNLQHVGQRIRRMASFLAHFVVIRLDQVDQRLPEHHSLYLRQEILPFGLLLGGGEHVIRS